MIENDKPGTVRLSPDGVTALRTDPAHGSQTGYVWALSKAHKHSYWVADEHVKDWPTIYQPPIPLGTMKYRKFVDYGPFGSGDGNDEFEVAVKTSKGWLWVNQDGAYSGPEPVDNANGEWTTVQLLD